VIVDTYSGRLPEDPNVLQSLPGIGRYTAGAIASFAYGRRAAIVEVNTLRLYARLLGYRDDPRSRAGQEALWSFAAAILPRLQPGRFNQALMDLGATVCTPVGPQCDRCPLRRFCRASAMGLQHEIPRPKPRAGITKLTEAALIVEKRGRYLLRRRERGEWWAGLWDFPRIAINNGATAEAERCPEPLRRQLRMELKNSTGVSASIGELLTELRHSVTRYRIRLLCFEATCGGGRLARGQELEWMRPSELVSLPLTAPARRLVRQLWK
jgi:A/G-specific adenine glycosylase